MRRTILTIINPIIARISPIRSYQQTKNSSVRNSLIGTARLQLAPSPRGNGISVKKTDWRERESKVSLIKRIVRRTLLAFRNFHRGETKFISRPLKVTGTWIQRGGNHAQVSPLSRSANINRLIPAPPPSPHLAVNRLVNIGWSLFMLELRKLRGSRNLSKSKSSESSFDSVISWRKRTIFNFNFNFWEIFGKQFVFFSGKFWKINFVLS